MQKYEIPFIGYINIKEIRKGDILDVVDKLLHRGVNLMATSQHVGTIFESFTELDRPSLNSKAVSKNY